MWLAAGNCMNQLLVKQGAESGYLDPSWGIPSVLPLMKKPNIPKMEFGKVLSHYPHCPQGS